MMFGHERLNRLVLASLGILCLMETGLRAGQAQYLDPDQPLEARIQDLLGRMTLEEKVSQMGNNAPAIPRLQIPEYHWWNEALHGVASAGGATIFPQSIGLACAWNPELMGKIGSAVSDEAGVLHRRGKLGVDVGCPVVNIARDPRWGRTQEP